MNQTLNSSFAGQSVLPRQPAAKVCGRGPMRVSAAKQASWVLDQPKRLWEIGSELWYPGASPPPHLDASLPGDRGFDPLRLGEKFTIGDGQTYANGLPWLMEGELYNGRIAMLATLGVVACEFTGNGPWYTAVQRYPWPLGYWGLVTTGHLIYGPFEYSRWQNFRNRGETGLIIAPFDPLGLTTDYRRQSEVRHCRLGMLSQFGIWCQALQTHKGALDNLKEHLADPFNNNILTYPQGQGVAYWLFAFGLGLLFIEAGNTAEREKTA